MREDRGSCRNCEDLPSAAFLVRGDVSSAGRGQDSGGGGPLCVQCNYQEMGGVAPGTVESHGDPLKASSEFSDSENVPGRVSPSHLPLVSFCEGGSD